MRLLIIVADNSFRIHNYHFLIYKRNSLAPWSPHVLHGTEPDIIWQYSNDIIHR